MRQLYDCTDSGMILWTELQIEAKLPYILRPVVIYVGNV